MRARYLAFALVLLIAIAGTLRAATVTLGPEVALSHNRDSGPAAFGQVMRGLVTDGNEFLLSWIHLYEMDSPNFASRLDSLGQPEPFARRLPDDRWYASTGHGDYLAMWKDDSYFWVQRINGAGEPLGAPNPILEHGRYYGIYTHGFVASGDRYLLTVRVGEPPRFIAIVLDRIGRVLGQYDLGLQDFTRATPYDGGFVLAGCDGGSPCTAKLTTISNSGRLTRLAIPGLSRTSSVIVRASDDRLMITWWEKIGLAHFMIVGFDGFVLKPTFTIPIPDEATPTDLLWDGEEFLLLVREFRPLIGKLWAMRISAGGDRLSELHLLSEKQYPSPVLFAANETAGLLMWTDLRFTSEPDLAGLRIRHFSELADSLDRVSVISRSATAQSGVQIASSGSHRMAVWTNEPSHTISGWIDGAEFNVTTAARQEVDLPAIAASPSSFLVAWNEYSLVDEGSLFVRRYALDGTPLDEQPVEILKRVPRSNLPLEGDAWHFSTVNDKPSLTYDGTSFVLFAGDGYALQIARIDPQTGAVTTSSAPLPTRPVALLRPVTTNAGWYVPFVRGTYGTPVSQPNLAISVSTIGRDGTVRDVETPYFCWAAGCASFSAAHTQGTVTQLLAPHSISVWRSTPTGESLGQPIDISDRGNVVSTDIVWNGSEYVAAWMINTGILRVRRFAADGHPLDPEPFTIATDAEAIGPSIAVTPTGVVIAYSRHDDAYGGVPRARMRTLERLTP
jgi:hypothetical protein